MLTASSHQTPLFCVTTSVFFRPNTAFRNILRHLASQSAFILECAPMKSPNSDNICETMQARDTRDLEKAVEEQKDIWCLRNSKPGTK